MILTLARNSSRETAAERSDLFPIVLLAILLTLLAAARAVEPAGGKAGSFVREVGGGLTLGLLVVSVSRGVGAAKRALDALKRGSSPASGLSRELLGLGKICGLAVLLAAPGLATGWELGGTGVEFLSVMTGLLAASVLGAALGFLLGAAGLPLPAATLLAMSAAALTLWPASLGWVEPLAASFPAPESPPSMMLLVLGTSVLASGATLVVRVRRTR